MSKNKERKKERERGRNNPISKEKNRESNYIDHFQTTLGWVCQTKVPGKNVEFW